MIEVNGEIVEKNKYPNYNRKKFTNKKFVKTHKFKKKYNYKSKKIKNDFDSKKFANY